MFIKCSVTEDAVLGDSGAYSYGAAYADVATVEREYSNRFRSARALLNWVQAGTYTLVVSTFEPGTTAPYQLSIESTASVTVSPIPQEGAGMYHRSAEGPWSVHPRAVDLGTILTQGQDRAERGRSAEWRALRY